MRIFLNPLEMIKEVERELYEMGLRYQSETVQDKQVGNDPDFETLELYGYCYKLKHLSEKGLFEAVEWQRGQDPEYLTWMIDEGEERVNPPAGMPLNPGMAWRKRENFWKGYIRGNLFSYTYSSRFFNQIPLVINELKEHPRTRQAIIQMYNSHEDMLNWGGRDRVPCSLNYQFINRDGALHVKYDQRSCDFCNFFIADVYFTYILLRYIAQRTALAVGGLTHTIGSLHAFRGDLKGKEIF
jgi:thymidylate synthase